jgi:hypothetical protein
MAKGTKVKAKKTTQTQAKANKAVVKTSARKPVKAKKASKATKKPVKASNKAKSALHDKLVSLFARPSGATMHDTWDAGYKFPAMMALKLAKRRGFKVSVVKKKGELTRYYAKR